MATRGIAAISRDLVRANQRLEKAAAAAEDKVIASFLRAESRIFSRVSSLLSEAPRFDQENLNARLRWYFENVPSVEVARENAGYFGAVNSYLDQYPRIGKMAEDILAAGRVERDLVGIPRELVDALRNRDKVHFEDLNTAALQRLDDTLLSSIVVGRTPANTLAAMKGVITGEYPWGNRKGLYQWHAGTYVRTAQMRFSRQILKAKADEIGLETFVYTGPVDEVTRDFCLDLVGTTHTRAEIEQMDNGQTGSVFTDGGGYNCRHSWSPVNRRVASDLSRAVSQGREPIKAEIARQAPAGAAEGRVPAGLPTAAWVKSLQPTEKKVLGHWKGSGYYDFRKVQFASRNPRALENMIAAKGAERVRSLQAQVAELERALDRSATYAGEVYRGISNLSDETLAAFTRASEVEFQALSSSSKDLGVAEYFSGGGNSVLFRIKTKTGVDIEGVSHAASEKEVLLRAGSKYKIDRVEIFGPGDFYNPTGGSTGYKLDAGYHKAIIYMTEI